MLSVWISHDHHQRKTYQTLHILHNIYRAHTIITCASFDKHRTFAPKPHRQWCALFTAIRDHNARALSHINIWRTSRGCFAVCCDLGCRVTTMRHMRCWSNGCATLLLFKTSWRRSVFFGGNNFPPLCVWFFVSNVPRKFGIGSTWILTICHTRLLLDTMCTYAI